MCTTISNAKPSRVLSYKILSTKDGKVAFQTFDDIVVYTQTQGLYSYRYERTGRMAEYYLRMAGIMKREGHNRVVALCHLKAFRAAWHEYLLSVHFCKSGESPSYIDPYRVYTIARHHLLDMGSEMRAKRLKEEHDYMRECLNAQKNYRCFSHDFDFEQRVLAMLPEVPEEELQML